MGDDGAFAQAAYGSAATGGVSGQQVHLQLQRILASPQFRASKRCQQVLRFLVEMTLDGRAAELKERTIAMEVFNRPPGYEPSVDSTVRVKTGDVRRRLAQYYSNPSPEDRVIIELPPGSYVPQLRFADSGGYAGRPSEPSSARGLLRTWLAVFGIAIAIGIAVALLWRGKGISYPTLDRFWRPLLREESPVLLSVSYVPVYGLTPAAEAAGKSPSGPADFVLRGDKFIGASDSVAADRVESVLRLLGGRSVLKIGNEVSFHDLRSAPAVIVGYSYTRWRDWTGGLRYSIRSEQAPKGITEMGKSTPWVLSDDRGAKEDYALVARVLDPETAKMMVLLAGIEGHGTEAAAELVTSEALLADAMRTAPADWQSRNIELVLHVQVVAGSAGAPAVVARHVW